MSGGKETPRQKMIGMMYLFLTALLALNISKEVILAFVTINKSLEETNSNYSKKLGGQYELFKAAYDKNPGKAQKYWDKAQTVQKASSEGIAFLMELKARVLAFSEDKDQELYKKYLGKDKNGSDTLMTLHALQKPDDYDSPTHVLIGSDPENPQNGPFTALDLIGKMQKYRDVLKAACSDNPGLLKRLDQTFAFGEGENHEGKTQPWGVLNFYHSPVVASIAFISKIQTDVKNTESEVIEYLLSKIDATDIKISKIIPVVSVKSALIGVGDSLVAQISVGAIDTSKSPIITVQGREVKVRGGVGYLSERPSGTGDQIWKGVIKYDTPTGVQNLDFTIPFKVATSTDAVIDPSAMNVLYIGIDNPVDVAVPGADKDKLVVSSNNGKVSVRKGADGKYQVKPSGTFGPKDVVEISVSGETTTGGRKSFGMKKFRIKSIPDPLPSFGGKSTSDATISMLQLKNSSKISAVLKDFVFDGIEYKVKKFTMSVPSAGGLKELDSNSDIFTTEMKQTVDGMRKGQFLSFVNIKAVGPDGRERSLPTLFFKIIG